MKRYVNQMRHPIPLEDGTILAASGTDGSSKEIESISDADRRRYIDTGMVAELDVPDSEMREEVAAASTPVVNDTPAPEIEIESQTGPLDLGTQRQAGSSRTRRSSGGES